MNENVSTKKKAYDDPVTKQDVEVAVKRALGSRTKIINHHVRTYSEDKLGFMGVHRHLIVTILREDTGQKEMHTFFLKSIPYDIEQQMAIIEESNMFYKEANFYRQILPELLSGLKDKSWGAQCYLIKDDVLVFEDLKSRNYTIKEKFLDIISLKSALTSLAKLHASSILAEKRLGKTFIRLYPKLFEEGLFVRTGRFSEWYRTGVEIATAVAKNNGLDHTCVSKICSRIFQAASASKKWLNVVCHGDVWSYNMMFDNSKPLPNCILVDFQLTRYAPPVVDILQLFYLTMKRELREANEKELLRHYHESLCEALKENNENNALPNLDEILQMYSDLRVVGIVTATLYFPVNLIDGKLCAEMTKSSDGFAKLMYGDRVEFILKNMEIDSSYNQKITEVVIEMVERSKELLV